MPVSTVSAENIVWVNGRPTIAARTSNNKPHGNGKGKGKGKAATNNNNNNNNNGSRTCRAEQTTPRLDLVTPGSPVAVDCEGLSLFGPNGSPKPSVGRISIVNIHGQVVYDTFVCYPAHVPHRPPPQRLRLGVTYKDIRRENGAQPHKHVLAAARAVFDKSGIVVAHAAEHEERMLDGVDFGAYVARDTQRLFSGFCGNRQPALSRLASSVLGQSIQVQEHSSVEDARATMDLFLWHCEKYEAGCDFAGKELEPESAGDSVATGSVGLGSLDGEASGSSLPTTSSASPGDGGDASDLEDEPEGHRAGLAYALEHGI